MKILTNGESNDWLALQGMPSLQGLTVGGATRFEESYRLPKDSGVKTALARALVQEAPSGAPILCVITEFDVWPSSQNLFLFNRVRDPEGTASPIEIAPGHLFEEDELDLGEAITALGLYFVWGMILCDPVRRLSVVTDNDEGITWCFDGNESCSVVREIAQAFNLTRL